MIGAAVGTAALFLLVSAALAAGQAAAMRIGTSRLRTLHDEGFRGAAALVEVRSRPDALRAAVRLTAGALNLAALGLGITFVGSDRGFGLSTLELLLGVVVVLIVADLVPRAIAARHPVRLALMASPVLLELSRAFERVATRVERLEDALSGSPEGEESPEARELRQIRELGEQAGMVEESESLLVERAFRLDELTAWDVMTPRVDIFAWKDSLTLSEIREGLGDVPYSRVPVYGESVDDVKGIVYVREVYERLTHGEGDTPLGALARDPFFVPASLSLGKLLQDFRARRIHMGIVADEFGGIDGLVTLEDVLEELVGEIVDETDLDEAGMVRVSDLELEVDAGVDLRDINAEFGVELPQAEHRSLNGFILEELGHVPPQGESLERAGVRIDIVAATETQVVRALLTRLGEQDGA